MKQKKFISNKTVLILISFVGCISCYSCKKYLDLKSDKSLVTPNTLPDLQALLDNNYVMNANTPGLGETSADDYFITPDVFNSFGDLDQRSYIWNVQTYYFPNDWASDYEAVYNANYCLDELGKIQKDPSNTNSWNNVKGSALFYRGYFFLDLLWDYAKAFDDETADKDLGIVLRTTSDFNIPSTRATVRESYDRVIEDLNEAATLLPGITAQVMRPSKAAAFGALARTYLSMRKYDSALKYANATLQLKNDLLDYNSPEVDTSAYVPFQPFNKEIIFYSTQSGNYTPKLYYYAYIDTALVASYDSNDLRSKVFFFPNYGYYSFKGNYNSSLYPPFSGIAIDEIYLIAAECYARTGHVDQAMTALNSLLAKRWITGTFTPYTTTDEATALRTILQERRKELLTRGLRWIDIKRLNKEGYDITPVRIIDNQTYQLAPNSNYYALPLPADVIEEGRIPQN